MQQPRVHPHGQIAGGQGRNVQHTGKADIPLLPVAADGDGLDRSLQRAVQPDRDRPNAGQVQAVGGVVPAGRIRVQTSLHETLLGITYPA